MLVETGFPRKGGHPALVTWSRLLQPDLRMEADVSLQGPMALGALHFPELALSAYFPTDPGAGHSYYRALLDDLVRADVHKLSRVERTALQREVPEVVATFEKRRFDCPAVAVFSCRPHKFTSIWRLADPVPGRIAVADLLDLAPIRLQLFHHPPALAAVVDKRQARLYALILDELTELSRLEGLPIRRHKQGGWSATTLQRRQDEHARWNLGDVAEAVAELLGRSVCERLILAGPLEARAALKALLPPLALKLLTAEGSVPMYVTGNELAERLRSLARQPAPV